MIWRGQPWRSAGFDVMYNWVGFTVNRIVAIDIIKSFIHICLCFYFYGLFSCKIFISIAPFFRQNNHFQSKSLSTFFDLLSMETEARNNEFFKWFWIWQISNIEHYYWTKSSHSFLFFFFFFLIIKGALWVIYISRNRICFTHNKMITFHFYTSFLI